MSICALCKNDKKLENSHIAPKFVIKWLRLTSATSYMRFGDNPNKRKQDGIKEYLLCSECEDRFEKWETIFSKEIFHPYTNTELDQNGVCTGTIPYFEYNDWLIKFIISVQWRYLISLKLTNLDNKNKIEEIKEKWRNFLLENRKDTGNCESHILFLQSFLGASGSFYKIHKKINFYILRTVDGTLVRDNKDIWMYSKLGPIAFFSQLIPGHTKNQNNTLVRKKGRIYTKQIIRNKLIAGYLINTRPKEIFDKFIISDQQQMAIEEAVTKNPNAKNSLTFKAILADKVIHE